MNGADEEGTVDRQLLVELGRTSDIDKFFTTSHEATLDSTIAGSTMPGITPHCSTIGISSLLRMSRPTSRLTETVKALTWEEIPRNTPTTPLRGQLPVTSQDELLGALTSVFKEADYPSNGDRRTSLMHQSTDNMPRKFFELSLESPSLGRPSIEMPSTFSKVPSVRKSARFHPLSLGRSGLGVSSQESVFIAATQFPVLDESSQRRASTDLPQRSPFSEDVMRGSSIDSVHIPPTQYPASLPRAATLMVERSPAMDLFDVEASPALFPPSPKGHSLEAAENAVEDPFSPHDAVLLPPSDEELCSNPFLAAPQFVREARMMPSAKRVQFKPMPHLLDRSEEGPYDEAMETLKQEDGPVRVDPCNALPMTAPSLVDNAATALVDMSRSASPPNLLEAKGSSTRRDRKRPKGEAPLVLSTRPMPLIASLMLVWARWRPLLYAPAVLQERTSRTRSLWRVRFCHWRAERRHAVVAADDFVTCEWQGLHPGDALLIVRNRKRQIMEEAMFVDWDGAGALSVSLGRGHKGEAFERVELSRIIIKKELFRALRQRQAALLMTSTLSSTAPPPTADIRSSPIPGDHCHQPSWTRPRASKGKKSSLAILAGSSFWITLGSLSVTAKRTQKAHLVTRIRALGGIVVEEDEEQEAENHLHGITPAAVMLISNSFCRTTKTFLALLLDIPIVSVDWLRACEMAGLRLPIDEYRIAVPGGGGLHSQSRGAGVTLLDGWTLAVEGSARFVQSWASVGRTAGAHLVPHYPELCDRGDEGGSQMRHKGVLVERLPSKSSRLARWATQAGIMLVTVEWMIEIIISGVPPDHG